MRGGLALLPENLAFDVANHLVLRHAFGAIVQHHVDHQQQAHDSIEGLLALGTIAEARSNLLEQAAIEDHRPLCRPG